MQTRAAEMFQSTRARRSVDFESKLLLVNGSTQPVEIRMQRVEIIGAPVVIATYHDLSAHQANRCDKARQDEIGSGLRQPPTPAAFDPRLLSPLLPFFAILFRPRFPLFSGDSL